MKVVEIIIPASSPITVESKSLKLYLNSFYKKKFISESVVLSKIMKDLSKLTKSEVKAKFIRKFTEEPKSLDINKTTLKFNKPNKIEIIDMAKNHLKFFSVFNILISSHFT